MIISLSSALNTVGLFFAGSGEKTDINTAMECPDYPCEDVMEKENRYTSQYPHRESPLENLRMIREKGMDAFVEYERKQWTCPNCGKPFSVHDNLCPHCGNNIN